MDGLHTNNGQQYFNIMEDIPSLLAAFGFSEFSILKIFSSVANRKLNLNL